MAARLSFASTHTCGRFHAASTLSSGALYRPDALYTSAERKATMEPIFRPPLHRQRHQFVIDFVKRNKPRKVVDLGCGECVLLKKLRFHREIELLAGVDINGSTLRKKMHGLAPMSAEYLQPSYDQLHIDLYQGSVTQTDARLREFDLVTSIELIEHLTLADLDCFSAVVFGYMTPVAVIISTPNSEYNPLLPGLAGFRHSDHKFEWTRAEFQSWALKVCLEFGYEVEFTGVGEAPPGQQERVGFCSQIGLFHRLRERDSCNMLLNDNREDGHSYTLLYSINYPSMRDNNILRRVVVSEVLCWIEELKSRWAEKNAGERSGVFSEECLSEQCMELKGKHMDAVVQCGRDVSEDQGEDSFQTHIAGRCVPVPLDVLWTCCSKVRALSGNLCNLRHLLMSEPRITLSQDGDALLVTYQDQDLEEEVEYNDLDDSGYLEPKHTAEHEEDWEANV